MGNPAEVAQLAVPRKTASLWPRLDVWVLLLLIGWLYHSVLYRLVVQWATDQDSSHGFFVPAFALYVVWQNRNRLKSIRPEPSWIGLLVVVFSLALLLLGELGVELFTSRTSLLVLLAGLIILFRGRAMFRALLFPWAFLFLMIPPPKIILQQFTFPLQIFATRVATWLLQAAGIPAYREGNLIWLPHITLQVADACSGIRSLLSLITLAIIYGYLMEHRKWVQVLLVCMAVPIAITANVARIFVTGLVGQANPELAQGFYHEFQGWLVFVVALLLLFATHGVINRLWKPEPGASVAPVLSSTNALALWVETRNWSAQFVVVAILMLAAALVLQARSTPGIPPPHLPIGSFPSRIGNWTGMDEPLDPESLKVLGHGEFLYRDYANSTGRSLINLFIAYYPSQREGDSLHAPEHCIFGDGWIPIRKGVIQLSGPSGSFPVNRFVVEKNGERGLVLYWFQAHARKVASVYQAKYYLIVDAIRLHRSDGALIRLWTPMDKGESADAAQARAMDLGNQILPQLDNNYIP